MAKLEDDEVLVQGNVKVVLETLGEGWKGDYDPNDPDDEALIRFSVMSQYGLSEMAIQDGHWEYCEDASYCTCVPVTLEPELRQKMLEEIMRQVYPDASQGNSIKRICERLSWIDTDTL